MVPDKASLKSVPSFRLPAKGAGGTRSRAGIFAVLGNRDYDGDRLMPGAFSKTWQEGRRNIVHLWDHGWADTSMPTASIEDLYEIGKSDLPEEVLQFAPDAIGGAVVVRSYIDSDLGNHLLACIDSGAVQQMSFAYYIPSGKSDWTEEVINGEKVNTRIIREVKQYDTSDVRWGANGATVAQLKSFLTGKRSLDQLVDELKSGARHSAADMKRIQEIHDLCKGLHPDCCKTGDDGNDPEPDGDPDDRKFHSQLQLAAAKLQLFAR